jgi:hypothetical protein
MSYARFAEHLESMPVLERAVAISLTERSYLLALMRLSDAQFARDVDMTGWNSEGAYELDADEILGAALRMFECETHESALVLAALQRVLVAAHAHGFSDARIATDGEGFCGVTSNAGENTATWWDVGAWVRDGLVEFGGHVGMTLRLAPTSDLDGIFSEIVDVLR